MKQELGKLEELAASTCQMHMPILDVAQFGNALISSRMPTGVIHAYKNVGESDVLRISPYIDPCRFFECIRQSHLSYPRGRVKNVDGNWIETGLLRHWKLFCAKVHHGSNQIRCHTSFAAQFLPHPKPGYLIDTWLGCLTASPAEVKYVTLRYVWGSVRPYTVLRANLSMLQAPGALNNPMVLGMIPNTIKDTIQLTILLKERYLWVDALCIVQDDEQMKYDQINNMASIFANSCITIIAAEGEDANHGLRGLRGISKPRMLEQEVVRLRKRSVQMRCRKNQVYSFASVFLMSVIWAAYIHSYA